MTALVLTVLADDRPGVVDDVASTIAEHGGSWEHSHLAHLAGMFAGIVVVEVPNSRVTDLGAALEALTAKWINVQLGINVQYGVDVSSDVGPGDARLARIEVVGQDRPGIISEISRALRERSVSIQGLESSTASAPMSAEPLFHATATIRVPASTSLDELGDSLRAIADEMMVDLDLESHVEARAS